MTTGAPYSLQPSDSQSPRPSQPPTLASRNSTSWGTALVLCCLMMGLLAAWIRVELGTIKVEQNRASNFATAADVISSNDRDLGKLLADPNTHLIELVGPMASPVRAASLAWNQGQFSGVLFSDSLPPISSGAHYQIFGYSPQNDEHLIATLDPKPGVSVYPFHPLDRVGSIARFEVRDSSAAPGVVILSGNVPN